MSRQYFLKNKNFTIYMSRQYFFKKNKDFTIYHPINVRHIYLKNETDVTKKNSFTELSKRIGNC